MERRDSVFLDELATGMIEVRNVTVKIRTKERIRSGDPVLTTSIVFVSLSFLATILSTCSDRFYRLTKAISFLRFPVISYFGMAFFAASIILGWIFSAQLKESWRVGIHHDQKTKLIQEGMYRYVRNPYFISYYIMPVSVFLIRPSLLILILTTITMAIFHRMVLKEEAYLMKVHGQPYKIYWHNTGQYVPRLAKKQASPHSYR
jgi:protein-S-isoprenylcysteine O-methyltransferase Ste14